MLSAAASPPESEASLLGPAAQGGAGNTPRVSDLAKQGHQREQRTGCRHGSGRAPAAGRRRCAQAQPKTGPAQAAGEQLALKRLWREASSPQLPTLV